MLYYENFDLSTVVTPVETVALNRLLTETKYDKGKIKFLIDGFKNGFPIGYNGDPNVKLRSPNLKFRGVGNKTVLWNKVMKEVKLERYAGPFREIPFEHFIQSPIGLVPKDGNKGTRLIFHLSYPRGRKLSVNENTDRSLCKVNYPEFDKAIQLCIKAGIGCKMAKSDMTSAFRNLGIRVVDYKYLVMMAESPIDGKIYFFVDKCLPFGASISCAHFQSFSDAVAHIVRVKTGEDLVNYLDDYFFAALLKIWCDSQVEVFLQVGKEIRFPVSMEKTFWGTTQLTFLGLLINSLEQLVSVPVEKIEKALSLIQEILNSRSGKITLKQL